MEIKAIATFQNEEDGVSSIVIANASGFCVRLRDDDADALLPSVALFQTKEAAIEKAKQWAGK
jgi:hypothetical protein